jgi:hypothetical protein
MCNGNDFSRNAFSGRKEEIEGEGLRRLNLRAFL